MSAQRFVLPSGTVTFLLTDIEGSTARWELDAEVMAPAVARHYEILDEAIARWGGVRPVEQGEGDSVVAAFPRATDGLAAAVDAQRRLAAEVGEVFAVRMALHTGEAQLRDEGNYYGETVNRCARVRACGHGGQLLCTQAVVELVGDKAPIGVQLLDLGVHRLRDLGRSERIWQVDAPDSRAAFPPLRSLDAFRHNLPASLTTFVGRQVELAELRAIVARTDSRLVSLVGAGGCGKTRLALQLAGELVDGHAGGVWWAELAGARDSAGVGRALLDALGVRERPGRWAIEVVAATIGEDDAVVVIDNCEHLLAEAAEAADHLLRRCPRLRVVTTSREPLGVDGEVVWRVPSLGAPGDESGRPVDVGRLSQLESVRLFLDRAHQARPNFTLTEANAPAVAQICARLDGIPLAIELAAARCRLLSPERIADQLDDRFRLLTGGSRAATPRQQTLLASVDWSHQLLDVAERAVFRRLSAFTGTFGLDAAETVCADGSLVDRLEVLDVVGRLVDKSLLQALDPVQPGSDIRYRMLETIRQYALDRCSVAEELIATRDRHLDHYVASLEHLDGLHPSDACQDAIEQDYPNIRAALVWAERAPEKALRLVTELSYSWANIGRYEDAVGLGRAVLDRGRDASPERWARAVGALADSLLFGLDATVLDLIPDAMAIAESAGDDATLGRCCFILAMAARDASSAALWDRGAEHGRRAGDDMVFALNAITRVQARLQRGWVGAAETKDLKEALVGWYGLNNRTYRSQGAWLESLSPLLRGDLVAATDIALDGASYAVGTMEPMSRAMCAASLAFTGLLRGDDGLIRQGRRTLDGHVGSWDVLFAAPFVAAVDACEELSAGTPGPGLSETLLSSPWRAWLQDLGIATALASGESLSAYLSLPPEGPYQRSRASLGAAYEAFSAGHTVDAEDRIHVALQIAIEHGFGLTIVDALEALAAASSDRVTWSRLLGATERLRSGTDYLYRWPHLGRLLGDRTTDLDDDAFDAGRQLDAAGAVAFATRSRGARRRQTHGWDSLTPTELAVVEHAASGRTNPQIAEQLLMSRATVKTHLAHIFAKLGVTTRAELASLATARRHD